MDADTLEACLLAAGNERGEVRQGPANRDPESDADRRHLTSFPKIRTETYDGSPG
jgi:hypothetical protein